VVIGISVAAYTGYELYPRFDLPAATGIGLLALAVGAGVASFFSPCSFPLLVTLLGREVGIQEGESSKKTSIRRALTFALALSLGATTFLLIAGVALALGGQALFANFTFTSPQALFTRVAVGVILILLGLVQLGVISNRRFQWVEHLAKPFRKFNAKQRQKAPLSGFFVYGFGYLIAGFGWTGPILVGLAGLAFTTGGFEAAILAFVAVSLVIIILMFVLALVISRAQEGLIERLKLNAPNVKRWAALIPIGVGLWFIILTVFAGFFENLFPV
jgi:cytochrome c-type biogenesis protein